MWWWYGAGHGAAFGWWFVFPILGVVFWAALILLLIWGIGAFRGGHRHEDAIEVLRRRLAAGEITREQYENTLKILRG